MDSFGQRNCIDFDAQEVRKLRVGQLGQIGTNWDKCPEDKARKPGTGRDIYL